MTVKIIDNSVTSFRLEPPRAPIRAMQQPQPVSKPLRPANVSPIPIKSVIVTDEPFKPEPPRASIRPVPTSMSDYENDLVNRQIGSLLTCNDLLVKSNRTILFLLVIRVLSALSCCDCSNSMSNAAITQLVQRMQLRTNDEA